MSMEKVVTFNAQDHCFPLAVTHHLLPPLFSLEVFELPYMVYCEVVSCFPAAFTAAGCEPLFERASPKS